MKKIILSCVVATLALPSLGFAQTPPIPSLPKVGEPTNRQLGVCFGARLRPATFTRTPVQVPGNSAYTTYNITKAHIGDPKEKTFEQRPAYNTWRVIEPTWKTIPEVRETRAAYEILTAPTPKTSTIVDTYVVRQPMLVWREGSTLSNVRRVDGVTGTIYCLVEVMAATSQVTRIVRETGGEVVRTPVPAETTTIYRQELETPARIEPYTEPKVQGSYTVREVTQASLGTQTFDAVPATIFVETLDVPEGYEMVQITCPPDVSQASTSSGPASHAAPAAGTRRVSSREFQTKLKALGLYNGQIDGTVGPETRRALRRFQQQNGITPGSDPYLSETARRLGL
jgi:hypothetical protein